MKKLNLVCERCNKPLKYIISSNQIKVCLCDFCEELIKSQAYSDGYETACEDE